MFALTEQPMGEPESLPSWVACEPRRTGWSLVRSQAALARRLAILGAAALTATA
jgi:hypothetical protein